jgi:hypothetical protein
MGLYHAYIEYDTMDLEMLREVVPMLRQQLDKSMLDRNYVQLERVSHPMSAFYAPIFSIFMLPYRMPFNNTMTSLVVRYMKLN